MSVASGSRALPELPPSSRYELLFKLASGGMASVYVGRLRGAGGFWRLVAIKKAHAHLVEDPTFRRMLVDEARLASKIHHPNVVGVLDVEQFQDHLLLVMDYVEGASLSDVLGARGQAPLPPRLAVRIALDACAGLRAAHELTDASGKPLHIVHRDVSPQNLLVGVDGVARLADFGIAKSAQQGATTTTGALKGKLAYMAPEYVDGKPPDQRSDVFGLGVVIWEALANRRLFRGESEVDTLKRIVGSPAPLLSSVAPWIGAELDPVLSAALAKDPEERFASAKALGNALEIAARKADLVGSAEDVGALVRTLFEGPLSERRRFIQEHVAADAGPQSRPTAPMPERREQPSAAADSPRKEAPSSDASDAGEVSSVTTKAPRPSATTVRNPALAATINDPGGSVTETGAAQAGSAQFERDGSTLDGSGVSRSGFDRASITTPVRSLRTVWILGACAALALGAVAAIGVGRWFGSPASSADGASSSTTQAAVSSHEPPAPPLVTVLGSAAAMPSVLPEAPAKSAASAASARSSSSPAPSTSAHKPAVSKGTATPSAGPAAEAIPPNPYVTKP